MYVFIYKLCSLLYRMGLSQNHLMWKRILEMREMSKTATIYWSKEIRRYVFFFSHVENMLKYLVSSSEQEPPDNPANMLEDYNSLLNSMSRKWYFAQLSHNVSGTAAEAFWEIGRFFWPKLIQAKLQEGITKKTPLFQNQRKKLVSQLCPDISMQFGYLNLATGEVENVSSHITPIKDYERNPQYVKLYEEAHIQVINSFAVSMYSVRWYHKYVFSALVP